MLYKCSDYNSMKCMHNSIQNSFESKEYEDPFTEAQKV